MIERILEALFNGNTSEFESLLHDTQNVNCCLADYSNNTLLHLAVINNKLSIVEVLIDRGSKINEVNLLGRTPLHYAISNVNTDIVKLLIKHGADIYVKDIFGKVPLFYAIAEDLFGNMRPCNQESIMIIQAILLHSLMDSKATQIDQNTIIIIMQSILHPMLQKDIAQDIYCYIDECYKSGLLNV